MIILTLIVGLILFLLGLSGYIGTEFRSVTALIPSLFGVLMLIAGIVARKESLRKHAMHAATVIALIGALGSFRGVGPFFRMMAGHEIQYPMAANLQMLMFVVCLLFLIAAVRSFVQARIVQPE